ncbi:molybdate ABC transporter substrate-binding protein [Sneathiella sp.]|jgi:molybdate transport system substrate-binding protein|uniref:molybdate ABC transporter substrate-binding protein n=1 Tax=Sneathiella sp. TaxID=1964365 RepID=UPI0039E2FC27
MKKTVSFSATKGSRLIWFALSVFWIVGAVLPANAEQTGRLYVAVASNFLAPAKKIAAAFEQSTGQKVTLSFGSTGKFYAQIINGAPFQVFLSADQNAIDQLIDKNQTSANDRFTYAIGKLSLFSADPSFIQKDPAASLTDHTLKRLAVANPNTAPYGRAAFETIENLGLTAALAGRLVMGENISQTFQFVATRNATAGFIALSQVIHLNNGSRWIVPTEYYNPIKQDAALLDKGRTNPVARSFFEFLKSKTSQDIIQQYGYGTDLKSEN